MATGENVKNMYEKYPYPSPLLGDSLILDNVNMVSMLFTDQHLEYKKVLDAGCGTGHRLMALARRYKKAKIVGIDMTDASLGVAKKLAEKHGIKNVNFRKADILSLDLNEKFDIIYSSGVVHHLENPGKGLRNLCAHLSDHGVIIIWLYHPLGEHQRLLDRELLLTLAGEDNNNLEEKYAIMRGLNLYLEKHRYGTSSSQRKVEVDQNSIDADAYMHPIVYAYRFQQAFELFADCGLDWLEIDSINMIDHSKLIDLDEVSTGHLKKLCVHSGDLFKSGMLKKKYQAANKQTKLKIIELLLKPTGFTVVAGKYNSYLGLGKRVECNIIENALPGKEDTNQLHVNSHIPESTYTGFEF
jgi:SAM-dependent methyltransferase